MNVNERRCPFCDNVEDEGHGFLTPIYINIRLELIWKATIIRPTFEKKIVRFRKTKDIFYQI